MEISTQREARLRTWARWPGITVSIARQHSEMIPGY